MNRVEMIKEKLTEALEPSLLEVHDESHLHVGHAGAKSGKGHFRVQISSSKLSPLSRIKQHQLIYESLGDLMKTEIHALAIEVIGV